MKILVWGLSLLVLISCNNNDLPKDILPEKKMQTIVWDMLRADELIIYEQAKDTAFDRKKRSNELYQQVFQVNNITAAQFKKSFQYYQNRPDLLKPLFDSLQKKGNVLPGAIIE